MARVRMHDSRPGKRSGEPIRTRIYSFGFLEISARAVVFKECRISTHWMPKEARFFDARATSFDGGEPKKGSGSLLAFDGRRPAICSPIDGRRPPAADALLPRRSVPTYVY